FGKFTSRDGESLESYYSRFYKMMNELVKNQCHVTNHQVNVQFLLQLQLEWQSTPVQEQGETSSRHVDSSNMHTFYQHHPSAQRWTKDHPLEQVIGNPSQSSKKPWLILHGLNQYRKNFISLID
ncbi:hypothetical protein Tco_0284262, partial [Tanacetum coccineum]